MSLVFFREGVRVYNERTKQFVDDLWNPDSSALAKGDVWLVFGFLGGKTSLDLFEYRKWEAAVAARKAQAGWGTAGGKEDGQVDVTGLHKIIFERDGSLTFASGADQSSAFFKEQIPPTADIMIYQANSPTVCFIDLRLPGQIRSKMVPTGKLVPRPIRGQAAEDAEGS
jgi:hypothetical protein